MPGVSQIVQMRHKRRERARRSPLSPAGLGCSAVLSLLAVIGAFVLIIAYTSLTQGLPSLDLLPSMLTPPGGQLLQPTRLYDRSGEHILFSLEHPSAIGRQYLSLAPPTRDAEARVPYTSDASFGQDSNISAFISASDRFLPEDLVLATLASADPDFWTHPGFSLVGISQESHPTLAQRLIFETMLKDEPPGLRRALRERLLAAQVTAHFGREQVLEWYLNSAGYGRLIYGADAAARVYFGKPAPELTLAESAFLAALADLTASTQPDTLQAVLERQKQVIQAMFAQGMIDQEQADQAQQAKLVFREPGGTEPFSELSGELYSEQSSSAFANLVLQQLSTVMGSDRLERGGLRVITTLDYELQQQAECASASQLTRFHAGQAEELPTVGSPCETAGLLPDLTAAESQIVNGLQANVIVLDPPTGQILALTGAPADGQAYLPDHAPGSLITPVLYLTAFSRGLSPASLVWDTPGENTDTTLQNFDGQYHGPLRLRTALANDYLVPSASLLGQVGPENVLRTARQLGLPDFELEPGEATLSQLMQVWNLNLLEASQVFGIFANQGTQTGRVITSGDAGRNAQPEAGLSSLSPVAVVRVEDHTGRVWLDWSAPQSRPVISSQLAYLLTHVLSDEAARWPGLGHPNVLEVGRPAAVKVGLTHDGSHVWTVGYTPQRVVSVWVGYETQLAASQGDAGPPISGHDLAPVPLDVAAGLWHAMFKFAVRNLPPQSWNPPDGVANLQVCEPSGLLPTPNCPNVVNEVFLSGSEPTQIDTLHRAVQINRESGLLATVFTPPEFVEERVYMDLPPEALAWAQQAGITTPPRDYDPVPPTSVATQNAAITSPAMFATVSGKVPILGKTGGEGFAYYRVQAGEGLNPQAWLQIGQDVSHAVEGGQLVVWDTSGLDGLYTLRLQAVRHDRRVDTALVQVTVDNLPPEVQILYPLEGQEVTAIRSGMVTLRAGIHENLALEKAEFFIDNQLIATLDQAPFAVLWQARPGQHILRLEATDQAGNTREASTTFTVDK